MPTRSVGWHELTAVIKSTTIDFYVDGVLGAGDVTYAAAEGTYTFDTAHIGSGISSADGSAYYDNYTVEQLAAIPEASSIAAMGMVG